MVVYAKFFLMIWWGKSFFCHVKIALSNDENQIENDLKTEKNTEKKSNQK